MINIGIVGAAGYSGVELIRLLLGHPEAEIKKLFGHSSVGNYIEEIHPSLRGMISLKVEQFSKEALVELDLLFVAMPSGQSMSVISDAFDCGVKIIDIGGDFRLKDVNEYLKYYKHEHTSEDLLTESVYGLSEWNFEKIKSAKLIANPGCYPTSILLPLIPLLKSEIIKNELISIVSYSGTSGAGKSVTANMIFSEVNESVRAYKVGSHQHIPEIKQYIEQFTNSKPDISFVPHLLPVTRGIYSTVHLKVKNGITENNILEILNGAYQHSPFVRIIYPEIPEIKNVIYTNFCDISFKLVSDTLIIFSTIDNLIKGAAGQAIQNMNIMFDLDQKEGLLCTKKK